MHPSTALVPISPPAPEPGGPSRGERAAHAAQCAARAAGRATAAAARAGWSALRRAVLAIDPDVRRHAVEMPLVGLSMVTPSTVRPRELADDGHRPVVFVHGLAGHPGNFVLMRAFFALRGRRRTWSIDLRGLDDVDEMAARLRTQIDEILKACELPDGQVDVVAHSLGGLVLRRALADASTARRVARCVTLGTPHRGTYTARFADGPLVRALRPGVPGDEPWPSHAPPLSALWSDADVLVVPGRAATMDGAHNVEMPGVTHFGFLTRPRCMERVMTELAAPVPA